MVVDTADVQETVTNIVREKLAAIDSAAVARLSPEIPLKELGFDEFELIEVCMRIEDACGVLIPDQALAHLASVTDFVKAVTGQQAQ